VKTISAASVVAVVVVASAVVAAPTFPLLVAPDLAVIVAVSDFLALTEAPCLEDQNPWLGTSIEPRP
jgi:hypothetical protein